jgi:signal peptidase I
MAEIGRPVAETRDGGPAATRRRWKALVFGPGAVRDLLEVVVLALALYLAASATVQTVHVVGDSMNPTLQTQDLLIASKLDYRLHDPQRGDIIILKSPLDPSKDYIKRVIGLPGDRVLIRDHTVLINGRALTEPYVQTWVTSPNWPATPDAVDGELVPPGMYFVMGDNRDHSSDSRVFGWVSRDQVDARAVVRVWPVAHFDVLALRPTFAKS